MRGQEQVGVLAHPRHQPGDEIDRLVQAHDPAQVVPRQIVNDGLPHVARAKDVHAEIDASATQGKGGGDQVLGSLHRDQPPGMHDPQRAVPCSAGLHFRRGGHRLPLRPVVQIQAHVSVQPAIGRHGRKAVGLHPIRRPQRPAQAQFLRQQPLNRPRQPQGAARQFQPRDRQAGLQRVFDGIDQPRADIGAQPGEVQLAMVVGSAQNHPRPAQVVCGDDRILGDQAQLSGQVGSRHRACEGQRARPLPQYDPRGAAPFTREQVQAGHELVVHPHLPVPHHHVDRGHHHKHAGHDCRGLSRRARRAWPGRIRAPRT